MISIPVPSLPVAGTESPPVATMTEEARIVEAPASPTRQADAGAPAIAPDFTWPSASGERPVTKDSKRISTPQCSASALNPSRTSWDRFETGKSFPVSSSRRSGMPRVSSKNRRCSPSGQLSRSFLSVFGEEAVTKRAGVSWEGSTLQRPPPLMRIFRPPSRVRSSKRTREAPRADSREPRGPPVSGRAAKIAARKPAAPAPITTTGRRSSLMARRRESIDSGRGRYRRIVIFLDEMCPSGYVIK